MKAGFAKIDITPRVGVQLCGFGPYLNRYSIAVRDRLWARVVAVSVGETIVILVSCDLIFLELSVTQRIRSAGEGGYEPTWEGSNGSLHPYS